MDIDIDLVNSLKVGEFIQIDKDKSLLCTKGRCIDCCLYENDKCDTVICYHNGRADNTNVIYVLIDNDINNAI